MEGQITLVIRAAVGLADEPMGPCDGPRAREYRWKQDLICPKSALHPGSLDPVYYPRGSLSIGCSALASVERKVRRVKTLSVIIGLLPGIGTLAGKT